MSSSPYTQAGLGQPPEPRSTIINSSRISEWLRCPTSYHNRYVRDRAPVETPDYFVWGSLWHSLIERVKDSGIWSPESAQAALWELPDPPETMDEQDAAKMMLWLSHALPAYIKHYPGGCPTGRTVACEVEGWLSFKDVTYLLRLDAISEWNNCLVNAETKTMAPSTNLQDFVSWRSSHYQDAIYNTWLYHLPEPVYMEAFNRPSKPAFYGTVYDLARKVPYPTPPVASYTRKDGVKVTYKPETMELRNIAHGRALASWANEVFYSAPVYWSQLKLIETMRKINLVVMAMQHSEPVRNLASCMRNGRRSCWCFSACHEGEPLTGLGFTDREPDYIDLARQEVG